MTRDFQLWSKSFSAVVQLSMSYGKWDTEWMKKSKV